jgi:hypothetical protein
MTLKVNDAGTWRNLSVVSVKDGATWRTIQNIKVNDGGTWRLVYNALGFSPNIAFTADDSQYDPVAVGSTASFQLGNDGLIVTSGNTTADGPTKWVGYTFIGVGNDYEAQVVVSTLVNSGTPSGSYHAYAVLGTAIAYNQATPYTSAWTALTSARITSAYAGSDSGNPANISSLQGTVYIRQTGTTTPVASVSFAISAEANS